MLKFCFLALGILLVGVLIIPEHIDEIEAQEISYNHSTIDWASISDNGRASSIFVDDSGYIWVGNRDTNFSGTGDRPLLKLDSNGNIIFQMSSIVGSSNCVDRFGSADGILVTSSNIFILSLTGTCIVVYDSSGNYLGTTGPNFDSKQSKWDNPLAMDTDSDGYIWIADSRNHRITKWSQDGYYFTGINIGGGNCIDTSPELLQPPYMASDYCERFPNSSQYPPISGSGDYQFENPKSLAIDDSNNIYVLDDVLKRVQKFSQDGTFITKWSLSDFGNPKDIAASNGNIYVLDASLMNIRVYDGSGNHLRMIGSDSENPYDFNGLENCIFKCMDIDSSGKIYVVDNSKIHIFEEVITSNSPDTEPPTISVTGTTTDQWGNTVIPLTMSDTTNFPTATWSISASDDVGVTNGPTCWINDFDNPWNSDTQSYDFDKISYPLVSEVTQFPTGNTNVSCAASDAAGNHGWASFIVTVPNDNRIGYVQWMDKPNSFTNTGDWATNISYSVNSGQALHLLKPIADLLTDSNSQGMIARDETRTLLDGALVLDDNPDSFYTVGQYTVGNTGYGIELPKPLADMLTDSNMAGMAERVNPTRSWSGDGWSVEISEDVSWLSPIFAMVKICDDGGTCQENHVIKPLADLLNESNLNQEMFERTSLRLIDASGDSPTSQNTEEQSDSSTIQAITSPFVIDLDSSNWNDKIWPARVTADNSGNVYIVAIQYPDPYNPSAPYNDPLVKIKKYSSTGNLIFTIPTTWDHFFGTGPLQSPADLAVDSSQNVYVIIRSNPSDTIQKYDSSGSHPQTFATLNFHPFSIVIDDSDNVHISGYDEINDQGVVSVFDSSGTLLQTFTTHNGIVKLGLDDLGNSWLFDNNILEKFDSSGNLLFTKTIATENRLSQFAGLTVNSDGVVFAPNNDNSEINLFDSSGNFIKSFGSPGTGVGEFAGWNPSGGVHVSGPMDVDVDSAGNIYVAGYGGHRVQVFPPDYFDNASYDNTPPTVTSTVDRAVFGNGPTTVTYDSPTATDNIGVVSGPTCDPSSGSSFPLGVTTVTCTATDAAGNTGESTFKVKVGDDVLSSGFITFTETIDGGSNWGYPDYPGSGGNTIFQFPSGISYKNPENIDSQGNSYIVQNSNNVGSGYNFVQKLSSSGDVLFQLGSAGISSELGYFYNPEDVVVDSNDNFYVADRTNQRIQVFDSDGFYLFSITSGASSFSGDLYNLAIDNSNNLYVADNLNQRIIHVFSNSFGVDYSSDTTPPVIADLENLNITTTNSTGAFLNFTATATDDVTLVSLECNPTSETEFPVGTTTVTCTATDAAGNTSNKQFEVSVQFQDVIPPSVQFSSDVYLVQTLDDQGTVVHYDGPVHISAVDNFDDSLTTVCSPLSGSTFPIGNSTVTCTATDTSGNIGTDEIHIIVELTDEDTAEPFVLTENISTQTNNPSGSQITFSVTATDNIGLSGEPTCSPSSGSTFPIGNSTVTCTATDTSGNVGTSSFWINLEYTTIDILPPVITTDTSQTFTITNSTGLLVSYDAATATDDTGISITPVCTPSSGTLFPVGVTSVTCTATDTSGNVGTGSFAITVINTEATGDNIPPTFTTPQDITLDATTSNGATVTYNLPQVTDNIGVTSGPICTPSSGSFFPIGPTIVTCTATDGSGNQGSTTFTVTVSSLIAAPEVIPTSVSVQSGKTHYSSTEAIFVSGTASPSTDDDVTIQVTDTAGNLVSVESFPEESAGTYSGIIFPSSLWNSNGTYSVTAEYGTATNGTSFEFEYIPTEIDNSSIPSGITLSLDSPQVILGDNLQVTSTLSGGSSGQAIVIKVTDPTGESVLLQSLNTDDSGSVELSIDIQNDWIVGQYTITASDSSPLWDYSASKLLVIVEPLPEITVSPTLSVTESGDQVTSYDAGEIGFFSTSLESEGTSNVLVTVNLVDSQETTLGVAFFKSVIGKGDSDIILGFKIPEDAADGDAKIYVNTYTDWIDQGGIPISSELISTVHINGVVLETPDGIIEKPDELTIIPASGSGGPGCEETADGCYIPGTISVNLGDTITMINTDTAAHTYTSGTPEDGPDGIFDTSLLMAGGSYEWTADVSGTVDYFCMVHPWMQGVILVQSDEQVQTVLPENTIPQLSSQDDIVLPATFTTGSIVSYDTPTATGGTITAVSCTPVSDSLFSIGSTQVVCTATNDVGNTGMTSFMVTVNPIPQVSNQTVTILAGKDTYNSVEPLFVTGSVGTITGDSVNIEVRDDSNNLVGIEQTAPKESGKYSAVLVSNELWATNGTYSLIANYGNVLALDSFEFKVIATESEIPESLPTGLSVSTENPTYLLGQSILIDLELEGAGSGESVLLEIRDSTNNQVLLQSLNTDSLGKSNIQYQLQQSQDPGVYSVIATSTSESWSFSDSTIFTAVTPIPDVTIGDVIPTIGNGTVAESLETGDMVSFNTPIASNSTTDVLITVNVFDSQETPLGLAYFKSKIISDSFDIVLGLQIPDDAAPGLATVYINTYTDWTENGGVAINPEQISFIEISPSSIEDLELSSENIDSVPITISEPTSELIPISTSNEISVQTELSSYGAGDNVSISGFVSGYDGTNQVILRIINSENNLIQVDQFTPNTDGTFLTSVPAGKLWVASGEYTVMINHGSQFTETKFYFTGGN